MLRQCRATRKVEIENADLKKRVEALERRLERRDWASAHITDERIKALEECCVNWGPPEDLTATGVQFEQALAAARQGYRIRCVEWEPNELVKLGQSYSFVSEQGKASMIHPDCLLCKWDILPKESSE